MYPFIITVPATVLLKCFMTEQNMFQYREYSLPWCRWKASNRSKMIENLQKLLQSYFLFSNHTASGYWELPFTMVQWICVLSSSSFGQAYRFSIVLCCKKREPKFYEERSSQLEGHSRNLRNFNFSQTHIFGPSCVNHATSKTSGNQTINWLFQRFYERVYLFFIHALQDACACSKS